MSSMTNIYFIQSVDGGPVKIGRAVNVGSRLRELQSVCPTQLRAVRVIRDAPQYIEAELHRRFRDYRLHGEWFSPEVLKLRTKVASLRKADIDKINRFSGGEFEFKTVSIPEADHSSALKRAESLGITIGDFVSQSIRLNSGKATRADNITPRTSNLSIRLTSAFVGGETIAEITARFSVSQAIAEGMIQNRLRSCLRNIAP